MRLLSIDWTSDSAIFLSVVFLTGLLGIFFLEKIFPKKRKGRQKREGLGEIIE